MRAELARRLLTAAYEVERATNAALRGTGLELAHYLVISHLVEHESAATSDLGRVALVPPATLTRVLDKLVDLALVYRTLDTTDRRRILVRVTDRGRVRSRECAELIDLAIADALPALREGDTCTLSDTFNELTREAGG
ncbi:MarR family transcriptional regulator [Microbacterium sp. BWT-B31]|uniref:MarR family winged helix-turn-helix transcriptional regulator n=1 Tax=Microbacterium sp. BWT-B31 TaxID=3232072 RepID=UPI003529C3BD